MIAKYKVYSNVLEVRQEYTTINLTYISPPNYYNHIDEVLHNRFKDYDIKINHAGSTITINYRDGA